MLKPDLGVGLHDQFFQIIGHEPLSSLLSLPRCLHSAWHRSSEGLKQRFPPQTARIENSIKPELHDVLDYHPRQVIRPHKADDSPGKRRHQPALVAHQHRGDLGRDNPKEKLRVWVRRFPKNASGASHEQHQMTTGNQLQEHHRLEMWMIQMMNRVTQVEQTKTLNHSE